jgi:hypothetical protein
MHELMLRFLLGGVVVSVFSVIGEIVKPKSFAGLFGAAPSVAIATLILTVRQHGATYAAIEGRSMMLGAVAFLLYAAVIARLMIRNRWPVLPVTSAALVLWLVCALGLWRVLLS